MPSFMIHDEENRVFTIPQMHDIELAGSYSVTIKGEISVWDDHTKKTSTNYSGE